MANLIDIARGWYYYVSAPKENKALIEKRLSICDTCPEKVQISELGEILITTINKAGSLYTCARCTCPLAAKTADPKGACPLKHW